MPQPYSGSASISIEITAKLVPKGSGSAVRKVSQQLNKI